MKRKQDISGLFFSAFLVTAFVICSYFFVGLIRGSASLSETVRLLFTDLVFVLFGLILFYATRVGDGKQIKRFSVLTLLILDLPALYIILASAAPGIPCPFDLTNYSEVVYLAAASLGYGIPYTFLSGYEQEIPQEENKEEMISEADKGSSEDISEEAESEDEEKEISENQETEEDYSETED